MPNFIISDFESGLQKDKEPFLLPQDAFPELENAFLFRGRLIRKFGFNIIGDSQLDTRLRMLIGTTDINGDLAGTIPGTVPIPFPGQQMFSVGTEIFTSNNAAAGLQNMITTGLGAGTLNNTNGAYSITGAAASTAVYYYPGLPVMGLKKREVATVNYESTVAFDTQFAYQRTGTGWDILGGLPPAAGSARWTGNNADFFYTTNYRAANAYDNNFYVVNGVVADNIKYILETGVTWTNLRPQLDSGATRYLETAKIILPFRNRLVVLNTIEDEGGNDRTYANRARWSRNGDPTTAATSWLDDTVGFGGFTDAPTSEAIIAAQFVESRLIVFFEKSTWELVYSGNAIIPFVWKRINIELGCESTFSEISFDDGVIGVGQRGIHIANPNMTKRIDEKIPDLTGIINNKNSGPQRVYGIRDFDKELVMWTYPTFGDDQVFPNRVLLYNYRNNSYAQFINSFTCYGYYQKIEDTGLTWAAATKAWEDYNIPWNAGLTQARFPLIIAGNQQGWTFLFESTTTNDPSLFITDATAVGLVLTITSPDHNLVSGQFIRLATMGGLTISGGPIFEITVLTEDTFTITMTAALVGTYTGGGTIEVIDNFRIKTKNFQLFAEMDKSTILNGLHIFTTKTEDGEYTLNLYQDDNNDTPIIPLLGDSTIRTRSEDGETFTNDQDKIWHPVNRELLCQSFQLELTLSDDQMVDVDIQGSPFELHAIQINADPTGRL